MTISELNIVNDFRAAFLPICKERIVLYGTGQYTNLIVKYCSSFSFVGLMDWRQTGKSFYGLKVLSEEEITALDVGYIIIIANLSSSPSIYRRISKFTKENHIKVFFMNGIPAEEVVKKICSPVLPIKEFMEAALTCDVISFDLFDTLITRKCLEPTEVFRLVAETAERHGLVLEGFCQARRSAEKYLYHHGIPFYTLADIYRELGREYGISEEEAKDLCNLEFQIELEQCCPRQAVCNCCRELKSSGKQVVITSDMYLSSEQLQRLLKKCGIPLPSVKEIYVSNELGASKYNGDLFFRLRDKYTGQRVLHTGDNRFCDVEQAKKAGFETFYLKGIRDLMREPDFRDLETLAETPSDKAAFALFSHALCEPDGQGNMERYGYLFFGPLATGFLLWLVGQLRRRELDRLLFVSRDGYIFYKLYEKLRESNNELPPADYFLTSRRAASVSSIRSEEDIRFIMDYVCSLAGTPLSELLPKAYGIEADTDDDWRDFTIAEKGKDALCRHILGQYKNRIYKHASEERISYAEYFRKLGLSQSCRSGIMNFVGRGVTQRCLSSVLGTPLEGFYFALEYDADDIMGKRHTAFSWYPERMSTHTSKAELFIKYLFCESVFSAPHGQLLRFNAGVPVFDETEAQKAGLLEQIHMGIAAFWEDLLALFPRGLPEPISAGLADRILGYADTGLLIPEGIETLFTFDDGYGCKQQLWTDT